MKKSNSILKSTKKPGIYEKKIIKTLERHFNKLGYQVFPHSRFDIAWGSIISDLDLLLLKGDELTLIEVKSSHDNLGRIKKQFPLFQDYIDYFYIATDYYPKKWPMRKAGQIVVTDSKVELLKKPKPLTKDPSIDSVMSLKKDAICKLAGLTKRECNKHTKYDLAVEIKNNYESVELKNQLKEIVTCGKLEYLKK